MQIDVEKSCVVFMITNFIIFGILLFNAKSFFKSKKKNIMGNHEKKYYGESYQNLHSDKLEMSPFVLAASAHILEP